MKVVPSRLHLFPFGGNMAKDPTFPLPPPSVNLDEQAVRNAIGNLNRWIERNRKEVYEKKSDLFYSVPSLILHEDRFSLFLQWIKKNGWMFEVQSIPFAKRLKLIPPDQPSFFEKNKSRLFFVVVGIGLVVLLISFFGTNS